MTLYELKSQYTILNKYIEDEELDREAFKEALSQIEGSIEDKAENYVKAFKNYEAESKAVKEEAKRLADKAKALENRAERIKSVLDETLKELNIKDLKAGIFNIKYQKNPEAVNILNLELIPENYRLPQEIRVDKKAILQDIKAGIEVQGVEITQGESMRIK